MGTSRNPSSRRLAWFFVFFLIFLGGAQVFLNFIYNIGSTPPALIFFNAFTTLITFTLAIFQIFPGGMQVFFDSLQIPGLTPFLRRRAPLIVLSLILIISLTFNFYPFIPKIPIGAASGKVTPSHLGTSTAIPTSTSSSVSPSTGFLSEFMIKTPNSLPVSLVKGSDGNFWFTEKQGNKIGRITPQGVIAEFSIPTSNSIPGGLTRGLDGNLWFVENKGNKIGSINRQGQFAEFPVPAGSDLVGITAGQDGNLWFAGYKPNKIWRMTTSGVITGGFTIPTDGSGTETIIAGQDGNVWFVEDWGNNIGRITPQGKITEFPIPTSLVLDQQNYHDATTGPDGNIWFTEGLANKIGRITPQGDIRDFSVPPLGGNPGSLCAGPDGNIWFTDDANHIRRITTSGIFVGEFVINPTPENRPAALTVRQDDKTIWFIEPRGNKIGRITTM